MFLGSGLCGVAEAEAFDPDHAEKVSTNHNLQSAFVSQFGVWKGRIAAVCD